VNIPLASIAAEAVTTLRLDSLYSGLPRAGAGGDTARLVWNKIPGAAQSPSGYKVFRMAPNSTSFVEQAVSIDWYPGVDTVSAKVVVPADGAYIYAVQANNGISVSSLTAANRITLMINPTLAYGINGIVYMPDGNIGYYSTQRWSFNSNETARVYNPLSSGNMYGREVAAYIQHYLNVESNVNQLAVSYTITFTEDMVRSFTGADTTKVEGGRIAVVKRWSGAKVLEVGIFILAGPKIAAPYNAENMTIPLAPPIKGSTTIAEARAAKFASVSGRPFFIEYEGESLAGTPPTVKKWKEVRDYLQFVFHAAVLEVQ
jgi:hypothetical protein